MYQHQSLNYRDKLLFTPGPLTTSLEVKMAMLRDLGSRDATFMKVIVDIRQKLLNLAEVDESDYTAVLLQGSGTFGIESVISSAIPPDGKLLILINGHYGERIHQIAQKHHIPCITQQHAEDEEINLTHLEDTLRGNSGITHLAAVHCETSTGMVNPIENIGKIASKYHCTFIVDAMSSFGGIPIRVKNSAIDYLISSSNKCIEGVPGFSFIIAKKESLIKTKNLSRTVSLDLYSQWEGLENSGQFRFTPPIQALLAFHQALVELEWEGGIAARAKRYAENHQVILDGMTAMGFTPFLEKEKQGYIITSFLYPNHPNFHFPTFYDKLSEKGFIIYPGKLSRANCFRIGHIGRLNKVDMQALLNAIKQTLTEMDITLK